MQPVPPPEIIVTAPRLPDPIAERAYGIVRIGREALESSPSLQIEEILRAVPGVTLFRRSDARSGNPTSQGVTLRALGGNASSRALLLLDGVPQSDPFGGWINWPAYAPSSLGAVSVIRGGGAVASGPGALAGVIAMESRLAQGVEAKVEAGSRQSIAASFGAGARLGPGRLAIHAAGQRGDGFVPQVDAGAVDRPAAYRNGSIRGLWIAPVGARTDLQLAASAFDDKRERGVPFSGNRTTGGDVSARLLGGDLRWSATVYRQWRDFENSFASVTGDRSEARRVAFQDEVPSTATGGSVELRPSLGAIALRLGADARRSEGETRELYFYVDGDPTRRRIAGGSTTTAGLFGEVAVPMGATTVSAGIRIDHWRIGEGRLIERPLAGGAPFRDDRFESRDGWLPTARVGLVREEGAATLRAASYLGWRMPTLNELFRPFRVGADATAANPSLDPEKLAGIEAGVDVRQGAMTLSGTVFANRLRDGIANVTLGRGPGIFPGVGFVTGTYRQRRNLDSIDVVGIEASAEWRRGEWSAGGGASLTRARVRADDEAAALDGLRPAQTPRLSLSGRIGWEREGHRAALHLRHEGSRFEDDLGTLVLPAATLIDAAAAVPLGDRAELSLRVENLLDSRALASLDSDGSAERSTPRTFWVGLRLTGGKR